MRYCTVKDCNNKYAARGYCGKHYQRISRGCDIGVSRLTERPAIVEGDIAKIPLGVNAKDGYAIVDKEFAWLDKCKWIIDGHGYAHNGEIGKMHHIIISKPEKGFVVDHKNNNPLDNRLSNLRVVTHQQNMMNQRVHSNSKSGYKGVHLINGKWRVQICVFGKRHSIGYYINLEQAILAYNRAAIRYFGEYAWLNKINEGVA